MLLQWCTLVPSGPSNIAAIRFASPVRIQSISIFPKGSKPFAQNDDIIANTEPDAFFLEFFFNSHPLSLPNVKEKPKPSNALVSTTAAYAGGLASFEVNMGRDTATRLMIVKGSFEAVSMAIYGDVSSEMPPPSATYEPREQVAFEPTPLSNVLDPSNTRDPAQLARQLLNLISDAPPLPLVIRLMFCLKPPNDDWDLPEFPYLHPDLTQIEEDTTLEQFATLTSKPVSDATEPEQLQSFAERIAQNVTDMDKDDNQAKFVAEILHNVASQKPELAAALMQTLELESCFDESSLRNGALAQLVIASANADVARHFRSEWFLTTITSLSKSNSVDRGVRKDAQDLLARIEGWEVIEDALSNTQGDFAAAADALVELTSDERSFGIWLNSMVTHQDLVAKHSENPTLPSPLQHPPLLLKKPKPSVSHDEFIAFLRAFIGASCVLAVYAWADSVPDAKCRERTLGILRLWQGIPGFREIIGHLLLLRQMTFRLECMLEYDVPTNARNDAEHILVDLARNSRSFLHSDFVNCILNLESPFTYITDDEHASMRHAALLADDGMIGAVEELAVVPTRPLTLRSIRGVQVALALLERELDDDQEYEILQEFWAESSRQNQSPQGHMSSLIAVFTTISEEIETYFGYYTPPAAPSGLIGQLFNTANELLRSITRILPIYPLAGRAMRILVAHITNIFACTDTVDVHYSQSSVACIAAQETRQLCIDTIRILAEPVERTSSTKPNGQIVLKALLLHASQSGTRDPTHHLSQVFCLIDYLLPMDADDPLVKTWLTTIFPAILKDLSVFCNLLDVENRAHFIRRIVALDVETEVGIADWLLHEELKVLLNPLRELSDASLNDHYRYVKQYQVTQTLRLLVDLLSNDSSVTSWCTAAFSKGSDLVRTFATSLWSIINLEVMSPYLLKVVQLLGAEHESIDVELKYCLSLILLRSAASNDTSSQELTSILTEATTILSSLPLSDIDFGRLGTDLGFLLCAMQAYPQCLEGEVPDALVSLLDWFTQSSIQSKSQSATITAISAEAFASVVDSLRAVLSEDRQLILDGVVSDIVLGDSTIIPNLTFLPDNVELSLNDLQDLLSVEAPVPSTPPRKAFTQDILSLVTISPPTALIRSSGTTGLTKTYSRNDFRQLRQIPSARQNTSRLPSMHVDVGSIVV